MNNLTDERIKEYAQESYCDCVRDDKELHLEHMNTELKVKSEMTDGTLKITLRHPVKHNRVFKCTIDVYDVNNTDDFCNVITNSFLDDDDAKEEFEDNFMTRIINYLQDGDEDL